MSNTLIEKYLGEGKSAPVPTGSRPYNVEIVFQLKAMPKEDAEKAATKILKDISKDKNVIRVGTFIVK